MDIDASEVIRNFVSQYDMNGLITCNITSSLQEEFSNDKIVLYPNPTNGIVTIQLESSEKKAYTLYSTLGEKVFSGVVRAGNQSIDISNLAASVYYLRIDNKAVKLIKTN